MADGSIPGSGSISQFYMLPRSPSRSVPSVCRLLTGPVLFEHFTFPVGGPVALWIPYGMALLPNKLHGHAHFLLLQFLHTGEWFFHCIVFFFV